MRRRGRTIHKDLFMVYKGIREFNRILPGQMQMVVSNAVLSSVTPYIAIFMSAQIINELTGSKDINRLIFYILLTIGITLVLTVLSSLLQRKISVGYSHLFSSHEIHLNEKAYELPYADLEDPKTRELRDRVSGSIDTSGAGMASLYWDIESMTKDLCSAIIGLILSANIFFVSSSIDLSGIYAVVNSPFIPILFIVLIIISSIISSKFTSRFFDVSFEVFKDGANYNRYANFYMMEYLSDEKSAKDVRLFSQQKLIVDETQKRCYIPFSEGSKRKMRASNKYNGAKLLISTLAGGLVYLLIGLKALSGTVGVGNVVMAYSAVSMFILSFTEFSMTFTDLRNNNDHLELYFQYMDLPKQKDSGVKTAGTQSNLEICFNHVDFHYPRTDTRVLKDISLTIPQGKRLAIIGMNGSGKTTLIKLLCGLYEPSSGEITIGGQPIDLYKYKEYVKYFSVVFQDFRLLSFSLGQNVAASVEFNPDRVKECLRLSGFGEKLADLKDGVNQTLYHDYEDDGINLSGGEEQKVAIARALYKDAVFYVLDEPTAALDPVAEYEVYKKFNEITKDKTSFFISHRLSSCRFCDEVIVMDNGRIVQCGSHDELVINEGKYKELWQAQAQYYVD